MPELTFTKIDEPDRTKAPVTFEKAEDGPGILGSIWRGFVQGFGAAGRPPSILPGAEAGRQKVEADVAAKAGQAQAAHPLATLAGGLGGNIAATAPLMPGGMGAAAR